MKFKVDNKEIRRILEMHNKERRNKILNEQTQTGDPGVKSGLSLKDRLKAIIDAGCVGNSKPGDDSSLFVQEFSVYIKPDYQFAIAQESSRTPGKFRYLFIDNKIGMFDGTGKWQWVGFWNCDKKVSQMQKAEQQKMEKQVDIAKAPGAKTAEEWLALGVDVTANPNEFTTTKIGETILYKRKAIGDVGGSTASQKKIIQNIQDSGGKVEDHEEITDQERQTWQRKEVVKPGSGNVDFPNGLYAYFPPNKTTRQLAMDQYQDVRKNTRLDDEELKKCEENIKNWYEDWYSGVQYISSIHQPVKDTVQACVYQLRMNKLKRVFGKTDDYIRKLTGQEEPGPRSRDPFFLQKPKI